MTFFIVWKAYHQENFTDDKLKVFFFYKKVGSKEMLNFWPESWGNPFGNMQMFQL